jgi:hypothetical protein
MHSTRKDGNVIPAVVAGDQLGKVDQIEVHHTALCPGKAVTLPLTDV